MLFVRIERLAVFREQVQDLFVADVEDVVVLHGARFHLAAGIHLVFFLGEVAGVKLAEVFERALILADVAKQRGNIRQGLFILDFGRGGVGDLLRSGRGRDRGRSRKKHGRENRGHARRARA